ncbi:MAG: DUF2065 domain-containing protein [Gammaproteobacteria bacterium]|nr:DUF2065 domain-containing protein [Gammaproteobacteria bacterium]
MWHDLLSALALVMVIEGLLPFLNPAGFRNAMRTAAEMGDHQLRVASLLSMVAGVILLYLIRA